MRYDRLAPILLNEVQQQRQTIETQAVELKELKQQFSELEQVNRAMQAAVMQLQSKDPRVATR